MQRLKMLVAIFAGVFMATAAFAHAHLERAVPGAGATVSASPSELELGFTQNIVPAFSSLTLSNALGELIPTGKPAPDPVNPKVLHIPLEHALKPGTYSVNWHAVSVDTHASSGRYEFIVAP